MVWNDKTYIGYRHLSLSGGAFHVQVEEELEIPFFGCLVVSLQERRGKVVIGELCSLGFFVPFDPFWTNWDLN